MASQLDLFGEPEPVASPQPRVVVPRTPVDRFPAGEGVLWPLPGRSTVHGYATDGPTGPSMSQAQAEAALVKLRKRGGATYELVLRELNGWLSGFFREHGR